MKVRCYQSFNAHQRIVYMNKNIFELAHASDEDLFPE